MKYLQRTLVIAALFVLIPALALARTPDPQETENRQALEKLRTADPQRYARLRHNLAVFLSLPPDRQETLRKLDRDLQEEISTMRGRLERTAERYADWLDRLPESDRRSVLAAPDRKSRLARIRAIREAQWARRLPKGLADKVARTPETERGEVLRKLRQEEMDERIDWQVAQRNWDQLFRPGSVLPSKPEQLPEEIRETLEKSLRPLLSRDDEKLLKEAEGKWPRYPRLLAELADNHPLAVLGPIGPTSLKDMKELGINPNALQMLEKAKSPVLKRLKETEGKWPDFGLALREMGRMPWEKGRLIGPLPSKYMPARAGEFPPSVQQFIEKKLLPALDEDEAAHLKKTEGRWPSYPRTLVELARKHNLQVPSGPTRFDQWDRYRWRSLTSPPPGVGRREGFGLPF